MPTFTGGGENSQEAMIFELTGKDNKTVILVDRDGQLIDDNTMSFCYRQTGGQAGSSVVSCCELRHAPWRRRWC
jgi:CMP-N-acetylneuraminic acid synthetase